MKISRLRVSNYKSIKDIDLKLGNLVVLVGPNAAGKSNIISAFGFIDNLLKYGLDDAVSLAGGTKYIFNNRDRNSEITFEFKLEKGNTHPRNTRSMQDNDSNLRFVPDAIECRIHLKKIKNECRIGGEAIYVTLKVFEDVLNRKPKKIGSISCRFNRDANNRIVTDLINNTEPMVDDSKLSFISDFLSVVKSLPYSKDESFLAIANLLFFRMELMKNGFLKIFDFDPKLLKKPCALNTKHSLEGDGSNLASVINEMIKGRKKKELINHIRYTLPFIKEIEIGNNLDNTIMFKIAEKYSNTDYPSNHISDGTANVIAILVALHFERNILIFEEPERNIHPELIGRMMDAIKENSEKRQIILTTHNPEILKCVDLESIYFVKRSETGDTGVILPSASEMVKEFIENELGVDELFIAGLLGE